MHPLRELSVNLEKRQIVKSPKQLEFHCLIDDYKTNKFIKSPMNYIGGKYKILNQITTLFPKKINVFVDLFTGGGTVGINAQAHQIILNDNLSYLIDLYQSLQSQSLNDTISYIYETIEKYKLTKNNAEGYKKFRDYYNANGKPLDLFILVAFSFNHQIRFNSRHEFNCPFGKERSNFNHTMENNLINFIDFLQTKNISLSSKCFTEFPFAELGQEDFVYCDPPYLITTGSYNDGKRGFKGWGKNEELELLSILNQLNNQNVKFALSNVLEHKGRSNHILNDWATNNHYSIHEIQKNYSNSNYQVKEDSLTREVLITNY